MDDRLDDPRLAALLEEAVADVEPADRLGEIRSRVRPSRRPWWYAGGALVAAAASVAAVSLLGGGSPQRALDPAPDPALGPTATTPPTGDVSAEPVTLFWVRDTPQGPRLSSEPGGRLVAGYGESRLNALVRAVVDGRPQDPDYRNPWAGAQLVSTAREDEGVTVVIDLATDGPVPALGVEQIAHTVWAAEGRRLSVTVDARTEGPRRPVTVETKDDLEVLALVQLGSPVEGQEVSGSFTASGLASSYEATVPWRLETPGGQVVLEGFASAEGWMDRLYPWQTEVDVSTLPPGAYTFVASTADPSGGEGPGPTTDTRTVHVR